MKVELEKTFPMPATTAAAWEFLQDIAGVAGCMPGAKITERIDPTHYKGTISVRVGPAGMSFKGEIEVQGLFADTRTLHLVGKGSDTSGTSGASMDWWRVSIPAPRRGLATWWARARVTMSGKAAAFGGRMMGSVADQILKQFAGNFAARVQARGAQVAAVAGTAANDSSAGASDSAMGGDAGAAAVTASATAANAGAAAPTGSANTRHPAPSAPNSSASARRRPRQRT